MTCAINHEALRAATDREAERFTALRDGRVLEKMEDGTERILGGLSRSELKTAFVLNQNVGAFFGRHPLENVGFLTLTFGRHVRTPKKANKLFNSFNSHFLRTECREWIKVTEPHKDGRPHFHLLLAFDYDIRTGFDFDLFESAQSSRVNGDTELHRTLTRRYAASALPALRRLWAVTRSACSKYGVGRSELLPIRKTGEASTRYVGKYIEKGGVHRTGEWKGARLTSYSHGFPRCANVRFQWMNGAALFRQYCREAQEVHGVPEERMPERFGSKWAYKLLKAQSALLTPEQGARFLQASSAGRGG